MEFKNSKLWKKICSDQELSQCILDIRENCRYLSDTISTLMPGFTDHSVKHMDSLWIISDTVFTDDEIEKFTLAETFILGVSFYIHDLGMAIGATKDGIENLKSNEKFSSYHARFSNYKGVSDEEATNLSLQLTSRAIHAENASKLCSNKIPGLDKYIIEKESIRTSWSDYIGDISSSHHWSLSDIETKLGARGIIPAPNQDNLDLAFVACALRIIDYAHINSDRANYIERLYRLNIDEASLIHWKAQENINGPSRFENRLKYVSNKPLKDVEEWWLFYDMASGLDKEIAEVAEYLESKQWSINRFSLEGVLHVKTPKNFSTLVRTSGFEPIDIRFKPNSIERLVEILGGKTLYGNDQYAPLRELLQNSRDAILLRDKVEKTDIDSDYKGLITIIIETSSTSTKLIIKDNGIGMNSKVIQDYLLGVASDYWNSQDFYDDFPNAKHDGFVPTGKFGIGFLSVFMIGDNIIVETERKARNNLRLSLKGLGKHGSLIAGASTGNIGTKISVDVVKQKPEIYNNLEMIVKSRAPMLPFPISIKTPTNNAIIEENWWKTISQKDFFDFTTYWNNTSAQRDIDFYLRRRLYWNSRMEEVDFDSLNRFRKWPNQQPEIIKEDLRLLAIPDFGKIILCSKGIAVNIIRIQGLTGIANIEDLTLTASRNETIMADFEDFIYGVKSQIRPKIIESLDLLKEEGMINPRFEFIAKVAKLYGADVLYESIVPWISVILPPGDNKLFSSKEFLKLIENKEEIILSYGTGPWSTESICRNYYPSAADSALIIPVNDAEQPSFGRYSEKDIVIMDSLPKQLRSSEELEQDIDSNTYEDAFFLISILNLIAEAWKVQIKNLIHYEWLRKSNKHLCVHFKRVDLK